MLATQLIFIEFGFIVSTHRTVLAKFYPFFLLKWQEVYVCQKYLCALGPHVPIRYCHEQSMRNIITYKVL